MSPPQPSRTAVSPSAGSLSEPRNYGEALTLFERALLIYEQTLGADHWAVAATLGSIGTVGSRARSL